MRIGTLYQVRSKGGVVRGPGGAAAPTIPYQVVATRGNVMTSESTGRTSANCLQCARTRNFFGSVDVSEIKIVFQAYWVDTAAEVNGSNGYTVRCNVEYNGVSVRALFGGQRDGVVAAGEAFFASDALLPAAFGVSKFTAGTQFWIRAERQYAVNDKPLFHETTAYETPITDERYVVNAAGAVSQLDATGPLNTLNGWLAQTHVWTPLCVIGKPIGKKMMAVGFIGGSVEAKLADTLGDGETGGGYLRRALFTAKIANVALTKSGETAKVFAASNAKRAAVFPYLTHAFGGHGGNDYSTGETVANTLTRLATIWSVLRAGGVGHVEQLSLHPKTNSTDAWATVANQTPRAGYETGGAWRDFAHTQIIAAVTSDPNLDGFFDLSSSQVDATQTDRWKAPPASTTDGTHPKNTIHQAMATLIGPRFETLRAAYEV